MTENEISSLISIYGKMEQNLEEYCLIGSQIMKTESEDIDGISEMMADRGEIVKKLERFKVQANDVIEDLGDEDWTRVRSFLSGENSSRGIPEELVPLRSVIVSLRSAQAKAVEGDKLIKRQFEARMAEAREKLKELNGDKKKLDFYSALNYSAGGKGGSLDGNV